MREQDLDFLRSLIGLGLRKIASRTSRRFIGDLPSPTGARTHPSGRWTPPRIVVALFALRCLTNT